MLIRKERIYLIAAVVYCILFFLGVTWVNNAVVEYIRSNGWSGFNSVLYPMFYFVLSAMVIFCIRKIILTRLQGIEITIALIGIVFSFKVLSQSVLLTTELVHIPQFAIAMVLFLGAFPRERWFAFLCTSIACVLDEWFQSFLPNRVLDINDILLNFVGLFTGLVLWWTFSFRPESFAKTLLKRQGIA